MTDSSSHPEQFTAPSGLESSLDQELPCGRSMDDLLEQAADGNAEQLDTHQRECVHCQAALREFAVLWGPVRELADTPVEVPDSLFHRVVDRVHQLADNVWYTMELTEIGVIRVAARAVAMLARQAARTIPGVSAALGRSTRLESVRGAEAATRAHRHPHSAVGVLGRTAAVDLAIAVDYGQNVVQTAERVQQHVIRHLRDEVGLQDVIVNVTVDDVREPRPRRS